MRARRWVVLLAPLALACGSARRVPTSLRGYDILVTGRDTLSQALAAAFSREGLRVRRDPKGGGPAAAALVVYEFRDPGRQGRRWLYGRLFDARSSGVVAAAALPTDSLPLAGRARARRLVAALLAPPDTTEIPEIPETPDD